MVFKALLAVLPLGFGLIKSRQLVTARQALSYNSCGSHLDPIKWPSLMVFPETADLGLEVLLLTTGEVTTIIEGGTVTVKSQADWVDVDSAVYDACEYFEQEFNTTCPVIPGSYSYITSLILPSKPFDHVFTVTATGTAADDNPLFCIELVLDSF